DDARPRGRAGQGPAPARRDRRGAPRGQRAHGRPGRQGHDPRFHARGGRAGARRVRSKLFVPASRPELFAKAMAGEADALSFDLEDAVDEAMKDAARKSLANFLGALEAGHGKTIIVRVNGLATPHFERDVEAVVGAGVDMVNLPKAESADDVKACAAALAQAERRAGVRPASILANIETPKALRLASEIASASARVAGLQAGWGDLIEPLDIDRYHLPMIETLLLQIRVAAGEAGVFAYDGAWANIADPEGYTREAKAARRLGYLGKSCIHPSQIALANAVFRPTDNEIAHALRVVDAARTAEANGVGAYMVDGKMIDPPFVERARAIVASAAKLGMLPG